MPQPGPPSPRTCLVSAACAVLVVSLLGPGEIAAQTETAATSQGRPGSLFSPLRGHTAADAQALVEQNRLDEALEMLERLLASSPDDGEAWYLLGSSYYRVKRYEKSVDAWRRAVELDYRAMDSQYGIACSLSLDGRVEEALDAFAVALEAGFDDVYLIAEDPDLDPLRDHPRFVELFTPPPPYEPHPDARPVEMLTPSAVKVFGELYAARTAAGTTARKSAPVILLLHQAGSNSAEYLPIAPRLAAAGFHALAIDARGGGRKFGRDNLTVASLGRRGSYDDAMEDFRTAISYLRAEGFSGPLMVWGSSYSASLMFNLAMEGGIAAGLAFSSHPPVDEDGKPVAPRFEVPVFVTWPEPELGDEQLAAFDLIAAERKVLFRQQGGTHGSSTLNPETNPRAEEIWKAVLVFLDSNSTASGDRDTAAGPNRPVNGEGPATGHEKENR